MSTSRHARLRDAVLSELQALTFTGLSAGNIVARNVPIDRGLTSLPALVVCAFGSEQPDPNASSTGHDSFRLPLALTWHEAANQDATAGDTFLLWREITVDHFLRKPVAAVLGCYKVEIDYGPIVDLEEWRVSNLNLSYLTLWGLIQRART